MAMQLEKIFEVLGGPTEMKARMAIYKLEEDANCWWRNTKIVFSAQNIPLTWESFQKEFNEKILPKIYEDRKGERIPGHTTR